MIKIENISKTYHTKCRDNIAALKDVSITFEDKGLVFILGKSGCGKTTLLNIIGTLDKPDNGKIVANLSDKTYDVSNLSEQSQAEYRNLEIGFVFQHYNLIEEWSVFDNIALVLKQQIGYDKAEIQTRVDEILDYVGLTDLAQRKVFELSGGQMQRVAIARSIIKSPSFILADEPTGNLDSESGTNVFNLLKKISEDRLVIVVSHDSESANEYADRIIKFSDGKIVSDSPNESVVHVSDAVVPEAKHTKAAKRLPKKTIFTAALSDIFSMKVRMIIMTIIFVIVFTSGIVILNYTTADIGNAVSRYISNTNDDNITFYHTVKYKNSLNNDEQQTLSYSNKLITKIQDLFESERIFGYKSYAELSKYTENKEDMPLNYSVRMFTKLPKYIELCSGSVPNSNNEVCITDCLSMRMFGTEDSVGKYVQINNVKLLVCGVIKTDYVEYDIIAKLEKDRYATQPQYRLDTDYNIILVNSDISSAFRAEAKSVSIPYSNVLAFNEVNYLSGSATYSSISNLTDYEIVYGRMPENENEMLVSYDYASQNYYYTEYGINDEYFFGLMNIHDKKYNDCYLSSYNMINDFSDIKIVGVVSSSSIEVFADYWMSDAGFSKLKKAYYSYMTDAFNIDFVGMELSDMREALNSLYDDGYYTQGSRIDTIKYFYDERDNRQKPLLLICITASLFVILLNIIFNSYGVSDSQRNIGVLFSLGVTKKDIRVLYLIKSLIMNIVAFLISIGASMIILQQINRSFQEEYFEEWIPAIYNSSFIWLIAGAFILLCAILSVIIPVKAMNKMKVIDLIRAK